MKKILEFDFPEDKDDYEVHSKGPKYSLALERIGQEIFRPARKHGYPTGVIAEFLNKNDDFRDELEELIGILEQEFYKILNEEGVNE